MENNATVKEEITDVKKYTPINSIEQLAFVERLPIVKRNVKGIYGYDFDNLYPQKALSIRDRSWTLESSTKTYSSFISGDGFEDEKLNDFIINSNNLKLYNFLRQISDQKSVLGIAIHLNYNILGEISEFNIIDFENLRITIPTETRKSQLLYCKDWARFRYTDKELIYYNFYNPETVREEMVEAGGIENYTGQIYYWTGTNKIYPKATFDACLDDGQYQAETKLFSLRNVQNDFSASGLIRYPKNLDADEEFKQAKANIKENATGANNRGRILFMGTTPDFQSNGKFFEPFEKNNVDSLFTNQNKEAKESIFSVMRMPPILCSVYPSGGWPNKEEIINAYDLANSFTEQDRKEVESILNELFSKSIFANQIQNIKIKPKIFISSQQVKEIQPINSDQNGAK